MTSTTLRALPAAVLAAALAAPGLAQQEAPPFVTLDYRHDTGWAEAQGAGRQVVHQFTVQQPGADWLRLYFEDVDLAGDVLAGDGAILRLTAHRDGAVQFLDAVDVDRWRLSTAYFNGDAVEVEVLAHPGTGASRVALRSIDAGLGYTDRSQCGPTDDRVPSSDPRSARVLPIGCTAWIIDDCGGCFITAGHCQGGTSVIEFNVPPSNANGSLNHPPPEDQYTVDGSSLQGNGGQGVGDDWAYFGCFPNSNTGLTAAQAQGPGFSLTTPPSPGTADIRITGYGTDSTPDSTRNQTQQTHVGPLVTNSGTTVQYQTDTTGGNSGSPVIWEQTGQAVGVHTHGGCSTSGGGQNSGTSYAHPGLQGALANPRGVCAGGVNIVSPPTVLARGVATTVTGASSGTLVPGSATLHYRYDGGSFQSVPMTDLGGGMYEADLPGADCDDLPEFYMSGQSATCGLVTDPQGAPTNVYTAAVGTATTVLADDFESDLGWTTSVQGATTGAWERGVPVDDGGWAYDPPSDADGSGQCYVTMNQAGNTDVDNGFVILVSPTFDMSNDGASISYSYYLYLTDSGSTDALVVDVSDDGGSSWTELRRFDQSNGTSWSDDVITRDQLLAQGLALTSQMRVRYTANDSNPQSICEAGVDAFVVEAVTCDPDALGSRYCSPANVNSTGFPARIDATGSDLIADNDVTLTASVLPLNTTGYFLTSTTQGFLANPGQSSGNLCVLGDIGRYAGNVLNSGAGGQYSLVIDLGAMPQPDGSVAVMAGETWNFTSWFRDSFLGFPTSNFTDAIAIQFQ